MARNKRLSAIRMIVIATISTFLCCPPIEAMTPMGQSHTKAEDQLFAFPGAQGAGKFTEGGRGGDVYHVTSLQDSGHGTLREAIESAQGPRTIVFDVAGMIRLKDELVIEKKSHLTIAGQTSPGKGITLADPCLQIKESSHIIVRFLRVRLGDENKPQGLGPDCITVEHSDHIMLDPLSLSWGIDGNGDFRGLEYVTLQWLIFSEALHDSLHSKGPHGMCSSCRDGNNPPTSKGYFTGNHFDGLPEAYNTDNYLAMDYKASGLGFSHDHYYQDTSRADFGHGHGIFRDPHETDAAKRYKMIARTVLPTTRCGRNWPGAPINRNSFAMTMCSLVFITLKKLA